MSGQEAYEILRKSYPFSQVRGCLDYGSFFVFFLAPINIPNGEGYFIGTIMDAVDKKTGRVFKYDLMEDIDAYERAKNVSILDIYDTPIKEVTS